MGLRGPAPKPTRLKQLQGNPGKRALNQAEARPDKTRPNCPSFLGKTAKGEWRRLAGRLHEAGLLTYVDRAMLAAYCDAYGRWADLVVELADEPRTYETDKGYVYMNPKIALAARALAEMQKLAREFGLTPSARSSLRIDAPEKEATLADQLFNLIGDSNG